MNFNGKKIIIALAMLFVGGVVQAETLSQYTQRCETELEITNIPGFDCRDGAILTTTKYGTACDATPLLGNGCMNNSRMGRLPFLNEDVAAMWVCRKYVSQDTANTDTFKDVAMIIHNRKNGKTCFFQNNLDGVSDGPVIPAPSSPTAGALWLPPTSGTLTSGSFGCVSCHLNDPFIITPHVVDAFAKFDALHFHDPKGLYSIIGPDFSTANSAISRVNGCGLSCHFNSTPTLISNSDSVGWMVDADSPFLAQNGGLPGGLGPKLGDTYATLAQGPIMTVEGSCIHPFNGIAGEGYPLVMWQSCKQVPYASFTFTSAGSIKILSNGKCVHPEGGSSNPSPGTRLVLSQSCDEPRLAFKVTQEGQIKHNMSGLCVEAPSTANWSELTLEQCSNNQLQRFASATTKGKKLVHKGGRCVSTPSNTLDPASGSFPVLTSNCNAEAAEFSLLESGMLMHVPSGRCIHPSGGSSMPVDGTYLVFDGSCVAESRLLFDVTAKGSLKHRASGKCVHPAGGSATPVEGTNLLFHTGCDESRLEFRFDTK